MPIHWKRWKVTNATTKFVVEAIEELLGIHHVQLKIDKNHKFMSIKVVKEFLPVWSIFSLNWVIASWAASNCSEQIAEAKRPQMASKACLWFGGANWMNFPSLKFYPVKNWYLGCKNIPFKTFVVISNFIIILGISIDVINNSLTNTMSLSKIFHKLSGISHLLCLHEEAGIIKNLAKNLSWD